MDCACSSGEHVEHCPDYDFDATVDYEFDRKRVNPDINPSAVDNFIFDWRYWREID